MATTKEILALIVTGDSSGAVKEIEKVGKTADKEMGKAKSATDKWAGGLQKGGAAAIGFSALAGGALLSFAKKSEEAQAQQIKLDNVLATVPALAGANRKAFTDLADAIHKKTVVDDDQVVSAEAMLGQFNLTQQQILGLTPLVVDLSRKMGIDLDTAAKTVGKAMGGNVGALGRVGIQLDKNVFATDRYAAVQKGLAQAVGGFAEREGKTFSGRLAILKNQLGDIEEGIGSGVIDAVSNALGPVTALSEKFKGLGSEGQHTVGVVATYGTAALGAIGATSFLAGTVLKLSQRFHTTVGTGDEAVTTVNKFGRAAQGIAIIGTIAAMATALKELDKANSGLKVNVDQLSGETTANLVASFRSFREVVKGMDKQFQTGGDDLEVFRRIAEGNIGTATRLRDSLKASGEDTSAYDKILKGAVATQKQQKQDTEAGAKALDDKNAATETATTVEELHKKAVDESRKAYEKATKKIEDYTDAVYGSRDANRSVIETNLDYRDALDALTQAQKDATDAKGKDVEKNRDVVRAYYDAQASIDAVSKAAGAAFVEQEKLTHAQHNAAGEAAAQKDALVKLFYTMSPNNPFRGYVSGLIEDLDRISRIDPQIDVGFRVNGVPVNVASGGSAGLAGLLIQNGGRNRAGGGHLGAHAASVVGERGPELFVPDVPGTIVPGIRSGRGSGDVYVTANVYYPTGNGREIADQLVGALKSGHAKAEIKRLLD